MGRNGFGVVWDICTFTLLFSSGMGIIPGSSEPVSLFHILYFAYFLALGVQPASMARQEYFWVKLWKRTWEWWSGILVSYCAWRRTLNLFSS